MKNDLSSKNVCWREFAIYSNCLVISNRVMVFLLHLMCALTCMLLVYSSHHTILIPLPSLGKLDDNCTFLIPRCCYCFLVVSAPFPDEPLKRYRVQVKSTSGKQPVNFNRFQMSAFRQLMRLMKSPNLDLRKEPDILFEGELGAYLTGPKREFFSRAMQSFCWCWPGLQNTIVWRPGRPPHPIV